MNCCGYLDVQPLFRILTARLVHHLRPPNPSHPRFHYRTARHHQRYRPSLSRDHARHDITIDLNFSRRKPDLYLAIFRRGHTSFTAKGEPSSGSPSYNKRGKRLLERCADARNRALPVKSPPVQQEGCCCLGVYRVSLQPGFSNNQRFRVVPTVFPSSIISYRCNTCLA